MAEVNNCLLPDELKYHIEFNVWLRDNGDGSYDMGMTDIAHEDFFEEIGGSGTSERREYDVYAFAMYGSAISPLGKFEQGS